MLESEAMTTQTTAVPKRIPYGVADYGRLRRENAYYVDKTHYIPKIEAAPSIFFASVRAALVNHCGSRFCSTIMM
ncbi:MAG: AAA family ATPase [Caldilineaceae bacterium]